MVGIVSFSHRRRFRRGLLIWFALLIPTLLFLAVILYANGITNFLSLSTGNFELIGTAFVLTTVLSIYLEGWAVEKFVPPKIGGSQIKIGQTRTAYVEIALVLVVLLLSGTIVSSIYFGTPFPKLIATGRVLLTPQTPVVDTLENIIAGNYISASDKQGTGGSLVTVQGLQVLSVTKSLVDGDYHIVVTDGIITGFVTEEPPQYQASLGKPTVGSTIDITGFVFCDTFHGADDSHFNQCWEIHPIIQWSLSQTSVSSTTTTATTSTGNSNCLLWIFC